MVNAAAQTVQSAHHRQIMQPAQRLYESLSQGKLNAFQGSDEYARCLLRLLTVIEWRGDPRRLAESLPHFVDRLDAIDMRNILGRLSYPTRPISVSMKKLEARLLPCFFVSEDGRPMVVLSRQGDQFKIYDGRRDHEHTERSPNIRGTAYPAESSDRAAFRKINTKWSWFKGITRRFRMIMVQLLAVSFLLNTLALAAPLFIMTVYDKVIGLKSVDILESLIFAVAIAFAADLGFRVVRSRAIAYIGGRMDMLIGTSIMRQILYLPAINTESAPLAAQVTRIKEIESVREFFTGPLANTVLDLPFVFIFLAVIAWIAGPVALVPLCLLVVFGILGVILFPRLRNRGAAAGHARSERHKFLIEMLSNLRTLKSTGAEGIWIDRYRELSANVAMTGFRSAQLSSLQQTASQTLMLAAGAATIGYGTVRILDGDMTTGALIATMALVWRVLSPMQTAFLTMTRIEQITAAINQINQLMRLPIEQGTSEADSVSRNWQGHIKMQRATLRYAADADPALLGCDFEVKPGELVAILGANGSGKSTIMKLLTGTHRPQAGNILIDGVDIRQVDPLALRQSIAYVPQVCQLFHGTIAQNLRLAQPTANDEDLIAAAEQAQVLDEIQSLPDGFDTRIGDQQLQQMPQGFLQRLSVARAYLKDAPILLLDEPGQTLDTEGDRKFMMQVKALKGSRTIVLVTHRPSYVRLADRALVLHQGQIVLDDTPEAVLAKLPKGSP